MICNRRMRILALLVAVLMLLAGCSAGDGDADGSAEGKGKVMIIYTSDIHCGVEKGFGFAGLQAIIKNYESKGYEVILVDDGDAIQGGPLGMMTDGEAMIDLMNSMGYDVAIPGNHEFDYTVERFLELTEKADFPYVCCNFTKNGEPVFEPYVIKEAAGMKIAFVGVTTPTTLTSSNPEFFMDDDGNLIYSFMQDETGEQLYKAVQDAVDSARAEGADYVYLLGHLGYYAKDDPFMYADIIENTSGIDVLLDGHSHDTEQVVMKNKEGKDVTRSACGTKLQAIGYSEISAEDGILDTGIWTWNNTVSQPELMGTESEIQTEIDAAMADVEETLNEVIGKTAVPLVINDPVAKTDDGSPIRIVRRAETNLADLFADAIRVEMDADIGFANGGSLRIEIPAGDITYGDILDMLPFNNEMVVIEVTGQQILDALEWGAKSLPEEDGGFGQVSGLTYEIDVNVPSPVIMDENGMYIGIEGERRVKNVMVGDEPLDPDKIYKVGGTDYILLEHGDGFTSFDGAKSVTRAGRTDAQIVIDYIKDKLGGEIGTEYSDPYGQGRVTVAQ